MGDYNLSGLNPRDFEHLVQALGKRIVAPGLTPFGDGPDGGREATFDGNMAYPSGTEPWNGYLVVQCKFHKKPSAGVGSQGRRANDELEEDLLKFLDKKRKLPKPEYYLFVTNVVLTPVQGSGTKDQLYATLKKYAPRLGLKGFDVWDYDNLCRFIDNEDSIRRAYAGFITSGDVLAAMADWMDTERPDFTEVMTAFLQKELLYSQAAKLESAGTDFNRQVPLASVFVDLPFTQFAREAATPQRTNPKVARIVGTLLDGGARLLRSKAHEKPHTTSPDAEMDILSRVVVVGGPGQGKSTIGQFLCQLYRASILQGRPSQFLAPDVVHVIRSLQSQRAAESQSLPEARRFPIRIELNQFATELAKEPSLTAFEYVRRQISRLGSAQCSGTDLRLWLKTYPWVIVLDGLDEVPASTNRREMLQQLEDFRIDTAALNADVQFIATTRPQSYSDEFSAALFTHLYLTPLSAPQALEYGRRLAENRCGADENRRDILVRRLEKACATEATARLMQSPLQVTIMATLVERIGEPPQERYRLFEQYYRTIYEREIGREGPLSAILSHRKTDIDTIHYRTGLLLQSESEIAGQTNARLTDERFRSLVRRRLEEVGVTGEQAITLLAEIADSSLDRLVFLVRPQVGQVSFEIRSLQEFMAAEALLRGDDAAVVARLKEIAPIAHWRNVFLFAVGKCFVDREYLLENVICLCDELNEEKNDVVSASALWGSRLALDILSEGIARANPTYEALLARNALRLLTFPNGAPHLKLAQVYHPGLETIFLLSIEDRLGQTDFLRQLGAWTTLTALADRGIDWAQHLAIAHWPAGDEHQRSILLAESRYVVRPWSMPKLLELLPKFKPTVFQHAITRDPTEPPDLFMPNWGRAAIEILNSGTSTLDLNIEIQAGVAVPCDGPKSINSTDARQTADIQGMPPGHPDWAPLIAGARFSSSPDHESLGRELLWLSERWNPPSVDYSYPSIPWPLLACIRTATCKTDLVAFATKAVNKSFGCSQDWDAAETRWRSQGVTYAELLVRDEETPINTRIASEGFPIVTAHLSFNVRAEMQTWDALFRLFQAAPSAAVRSWAAWETLVFPHRFMYQMTQEDKALRLSLEPTVARAMLEQGCPPRNLFFLPISFIDMQQGLSDEWIQVINWFGLQEIPRYIGLRGQPWKHTNALAEAFSRDPGCEGLIAVLAMLCLNGDSLAKPLQLPDPTHLRRADIRFYATVLHIVNGSWAEKDVPSFAAMLVESEDRMKISMRGVLDAALRNAIPLERLFRLANAIKVAAENQGSLKTDGITSFIADVLGSRSSRISNVQHWQMLKLPAVA